MKNVDDIRTRANNYMQLEEPYAGETEVLHFLEVLRDKVGFDKLKEKVVNPLKDKKIGAYYGCLLLRPNSVMKMDDPENPSIPLSLAALEHEGVAITQAERNAARDVLEARPELRQPSEHTALLFEHRYGPVRAPGFCSASRLRRFQLSPLES